MIVIDTSIWIDFSKTKQTIEVEILTDLIENGKEVGFNSVILMELLQGCKNQQEISKIKNILKDFDFYRVDHDTIVQASDIYRACRQKGKTIKTIDCIIAASCIENDVELLHNDKHFDFIAEITGLLKIYKE